MGSKVRLVQYYALILAAMVSTTCFGRASESSCDDLRQAATPLTSSELAGLPSLGYIRSKDQYETRKDYEKFVASEIASFKAKASSQASRYQAFSLSVPVRQKYNAEQQTLTIEGPYLSRVSAEIGPKTIALNGVTISKGNATTTHGRVGTSMVGMDTSTTNHDSLGLAFPVSSSSRLLKDGAKISIRMPSAKARQLADSLDLLVVGIPAFPYRAYTHSSGEAMFANGRMYQEKASSSYAVVDIVCAVVIDRNSRDVVAR